MKGLLLVNLGTPDSPRVWDVWRYLNEFLTDKRVVDIPWLKRQLLVRGGIVPFRVRNSAKLYKKLWTKEGSPLMFHSLKMAAKLQERLGQGWKVELAMRYQNPSIASRLEQLRGCTEIIVLPLFPQYASATSGSVIEKVMDEVKKWKEIPAIRFVGPFYDHPKMIEAVAYQARSFDLSRYEKILFSFHGLPLRQLTVPNGYFSQCQTTAHLLAQELNLPSDKWEMAFQSRLGKEPWIEPYANETIKKFAEGGIKSLLVFSPAFVADCLETLQEIAEEYSHEFLKQGGEKLDLVPCLNDSPLWIEALEQIVSPL